MKKFDFDRAADELVASNFFVKLEVNDAVDRRARQIIKKFPQHFSFTDATSIAIMEREDIRNIFSFDRHFEWYPIRKGHGTTFLTRHPSSNTPMV